MTDPPRRDKFAALAQRQQQTAATSTSSPLPEAHSSGTSSTTAFQPPVSATATTAAPAPKRDKFAALAAVQLSSDTTTAPVAVSNPAPSSAPARRDKFAALASRGGSPSRPPASVSSSVPSHLNLQDASLAEPYKSVLSAPNTAKTVAEIEQERLESELNIRIAQRKQVWNDLEQAEAATIQLLQLTAETTDRLAQWKIPSNTTVSQSRVDSDETDSNDSNDDAAGRTKRLVEASKRSVASTHDLAKAYTETLAYIHSKLAPYADFVRAYQPPSRSNRMYLNRVELRLADQKRAWLRDVVSMEQQQQQQEQTLVEEGKEKTSQTLDEDHVVAGKRKREDQI